MIRTAIENMRRGQAITPKLPREVIRGHIPALLARDSNGGLRNRPLQAQMANKLFNFNALAA
jgi:hypothetical protein